jgi:hypothetical protein
MTMTGALTRLWGDTPPSRFLAHAGSRMLLVLAVFVGLRCLLFVVPATLVGPFSWRDLANYLAGATLAVGLVWFGFQVALALRAWKGDLSRWSLPALFLCTLLAVSVSRGAAEMLLARTSGDVAGLLGSGLHGVRNALVLALLVSLIPMVPSAIARLRAVLTTTTNVTSVGSPAHDAGPSAPPVGSEPSTMSAIATCPRCGGQVRASARFCRHCGTPREA